MGYGSDLGEPEHSDDHEEHQDDEHTDLEHDHDHDEGSAVDSHGGRSADIGTDDDLGTPISPDARQTGSPKEMASGLPDAAEAVKRQQSFGGSPAASQSILVPLATSGDVPPSGQKHNRKASLVLHTPSVVSASVTSTTVSNGKKKHHHHHHARSSSSKTKVDFGPLPKPSSCECADHSKYIVNVEKTYDLRLSRIWNLLFGKGSENTVRRAIVDMRKNRDFKVETPWSLNGTPVNGDNDDSITNGARRLLIWVCPLNSTLGPKQTRNSHEEIILHKDLSL